MRLEQRRGAASSDDLDEAVDNRVPWGTDDDGPAQPITLAADLPVDAPPDDDDPVTANLFDAPDTGRALFDDLANVAGVRFAIGGRVQWFDAGDAHYEVGERVVVDADRGTRVGRVAVAPARKSANAYGGRNLRRVVRRANEADLRGETDGESERVQALRAAKDIAARLGLPMKVYRVEALGPLGRGGKLVVYYTSDERMDLRDLVRELGNIGANGAIVRGTNTRVELRQLGVRDEAKAVGGIGSCGLTLCCTTWLPDFVPVSIKMAKDQGLVLSPTKVSGQCGRLKCCLVYEQAAYAELRKGLPKLGKRVIAPRGEGRVVEVDVLRQRIRVSYAPGETEVLPATEVKPLFPSGNPPLQTRDDRAPRGDRDTRDRGSRGERTDRGPRPPNASPNTSTSAQARDARFDTPDPDAEVDSDADETDDPRALANLHAPTRLEPTHDTGPLDDGATDDPSSDDFADIGDGPTDDPSSAHYAGDDSDDDST